MVSAALREKMKKLTALHELESQARRAYIDATVSHSEPKEKTSMKTIIKTIYLAVIGISLACFTGFQALGVMPPPDGGYPGKNTAEGQDALSSLTNGTANTANGFSALKANTNGDRNTANGALALFTNVTGSENTATGYAALFYNTRLWEHGQRYCGAPQQRNRSQQHGHWSTSAP